MRKRTKFLAAVLSFLVVLFVMVPPAYAASHTSFSFNKAKPGQTYKYHSTITTYPYAVGANYKVTKYRYIGNKENYTPWKGMTGNYYHTKGQSDLILRAPLEYTYTVNTTASGNSADFGAASGYVYSKKSGCTVIFSIPSYYASEYYCFGVKFNIKDLRVREDVYYKSKGEWVFSSSSVNDGYRVGRKPSCYYKWVKHTDIGEIEY